MRLRRVDGHWNLLLQEIPRDMHLIALGQHGSAKENFHFAFFAPRNTPLSKGTRYNGARYAEGTPQDERFEIVEQAFVRTTRHGDGSYTFLVGPEWSRVQSEFFIQPRENGASTCDGDLIDIIFLA